MSKSVPARSVGAATTAAIQTMVYLPSSFQIRITLTYKLLTNRRQTRAVEDISGLRLENNLDLVTQGFASKPNHK